MQSISQFADEVDSYFNNYIKGIKERVVTEVRKAAKNAYEDFFIILEDKIRTTFNLVIQDFYGSYTPRFYSRNESLYDVLQTQINSDSLRIWFDPGQMTPFRSGYVGEDGLYDQVFRKGWHGGAGSGDEHPSPGKPYWRTPIPYYSRWGMEASVSDNPPLEDMKRRVEDYTNNKMQSDFNEIYSRHLNNIKIE